MRFDEIYTAKTYLYFVSNIWVPSFARCRLTNDSRKTKRFSPFARKVLLNLEPKIKFHGDYISLYDFLGIYCHDYRWFMYNFDFIWTVSCNGSNHTLLLLMLVAEKVLLLLVISLIVEYRNLPIPYRQYNTCWWFVDHNSYTIQRLKAMFSSILTFVRLGSWLCRRPIRRDVRINSC